MKELDEPVLDDNYSICYDEICIVDGKLFRSQSSQCTVGQLKARLNAKEIRRYDNSGRVKQALTEFYKK